MYEPWVLSRTTCHLRVFDKQLPDFFTSLLSQLHPTRLHICVSVSTFTVPVFRKEDGLRGPSWRDFGTDSKTKKDLPLPSATGRLKDFGRDSLHETIFVLEVPVS